MKLGNLLPRIFALILLVLQGGVLDYFLFKHNSMKSLGWIATDVFIFMIWVLAMLGSRVPVCNLVKGCLVKNPNDKDFTATYIAWLAYSIHLIPQVATIFKGFSDKLDKESFLNPNFLKLTLSVTPMLFVCLIYSHHKTKESFIRKAYVQMLIGSITLDLFDSVEMLDYLFDKELISISIENVIIIFACINFSLPVLALYELKNNDFHDSGQVPAISFKLLYVLSFLFFVNVPFLVIRAYLWDVYKLNVSILIAKNIMGIYFGISEIFEYYGEARPTKCSACTNTLKKSHIENHASNNNGFAEDIEQTTQSNVQEIESESKNTSL